MAGCTDPPDPPPLHRAASTAPYVEWQDPAAPVTRPVALVVDTPGGPIDRLVADPDVTTFLNDQFHPVWAASSPYAPTGSVRFFTPAGCPLGEALRPTDPAALIAAANAVIVRPEARSGHAPHLDLDCAAR